MKIMIRFIELCSLITIEIEILLNGNRSCYYLMSITSMTFIVCCPLIFITFKCIHYSHGMLNSQRLK